MRLNCYNVLGVLIVLDVLAVAFYDQIWWQERKKYMIFPYENLHIAQLARMLINKTYQITQGFPREELFALNSQLRRASVSVLLNIAEGSGRHSKREYAQFIRNSLGSLIEVDAALKIGLDQKYLDSKKYKQEFSPVIEKLYFKLIGFEKSLIGKRFERVKR